MITVFDTTQEYNTYASNGLQSGNLYYVKDDGSVHFRTNNIDGEDKTYNMSEGGGSEPELNWVQATPNANYYNAKMVDGLEIGKTYRIHITYTKEEGEEGYDNPYFFFVYSKNNSWDTYSNVMDINSGNYSQIQIEADSADFYYDITFPKFINIDSGDDYGIAIQQGLWGAYPVASMEIALLHN